jgi:hypothetical protein
MTNDFNDACPLCGEISLFTIEIGEDWEKISCPGRKYYICWTPEHGDICWPTKHQLELDEKARQ